VTRASAIMRPRYGAGSLADVLPSALAVLGVPDAPDPLGLRAALPGVRRIAVLLVDGFGYHLLPKAAPVAPTVADVLAGRLGSLTMLTSGFPSTTPTSLVSLGTGVAPGAHGVLGFTVNVPGTNRVLNHVDWTDDPDPRGWQPVPTQFARAAAAGVRVAVASRPRFAGTGLTRSAYRGAPYRAAADLDELAEALLDGVSEAPALSYGYHPTLDRTGHVCGVDSAQWLAAAAEVDTLLARVVDGLPADAALLVTADHGQLDVPAGYRFDVDTDPRLSAGVAVVAGDPRARYLHTAPGAAGDVIAAWRAVLGAAAWVAGRDEAVAAGWFGPVPEDHLARIGDVVVACHDRYAVLATQHEAPAVAALIGHHGSYTELEMAIPLIAITRP
jgi:hypothetical protein